MFDIDLFKTINDSHGHDIGDRILQLLAEVCRQTLRTNDVVGRLDGDEFAVILPETDSELAEAVANRLCQAIASISILLHDGTQLHSTASIGATTANNLAVSIDELLRQADEVLYQSKTRGSNQVTSS